MKVAVLIGWIMIVVSIVHASPVEPAAADFRWQVRSGFNTVDDGARYTTFCLDFYTRHPKCVVNFFSAEALDAKLQGDVYLVAAGHRWAINRTGFSAEIGELVNRDANYTNATDTWRWHPCYVGGVDYVFTRHVALTASWVGDGCAPRGCGWRIEAAYRW
jgi:hypothetical protein